MTADDLEQIFQEDQPEEFYPWLTLVVAKSYHQFKAMQNLIIVV